ncbi:MAG TPA: alpha/beta hydrolase [Burkholderiaceae bacterium]
MSAIRFATLELDGCEVSIEYRLLNAQAGNAAGLPLIIFLHEGLGSIALWRDFPQRLCDAAGMRGLVYSRPGYGNSTPRPPEVTWRPDYLHRQADEVLPALLRTLALDAKPYWLFGHSDGASIALLHAASHAPAVAGAIVLAPHVFVERISLDGIARTVRNYEDGGLKANLARYHKEPDSPFYGWSEAWLSPAFRDWNIEAETGCIRCPLLVIQGEDDEYGTMEQLDRIAAAQPHCRLLKLAQCGHIPQRDKPDEVIAAALALMHGEGRN